MRPDRNANELRGLLARLTGAVGGRWAVSAALGVAAGAVVLATHRSRSAPVMESPPLSNLAEVPAGVEGADSIWVRHLGEGLYELVGHSDDPETARLVAKALAERPGVTAVVNRVFTTSGHAV